MYSVYLIPILIIIDLIFIQMVLELDHMYIHNKIFQNQKIINDNKLAFDIALSKVCEKAIDFKSIGFLKDELSLGNNNGINVYKISQDNFLGYVGCRGLHPLSLKRLDLQRQYYQKLFSNSFFDAKKLTIISYSEKDNKVFFIESDTEIWSYDIAKAQFNLEYSTKKYNYKIINYKITKDVIYNHANSKFMPLVIYVHLRSSDNKLENKDLLLGIIQGHSGHPLDPILVVSKAIPIAKFFIRNRQLVLVYQDYNMLPEIYTITGKLNRNSQNISDGNIFEKIDINFKNITRLLHGSSKHDYSKPSIELIWDQARLLHRLNIISQGVFVSYCFNLANDRSLIAYRMVYTKDTSKC